MAGLSKKVSDFDMADPAPFVADIVGWFFACYFISWLMQRTQIESFNQAVGLAALLWVGVAPAMLATHLALPRAWRFRSEMIRYSRIDDG